MTNLRRHAARDHLALAAAGTVAVALLLLAAVHTVRAQALPSITAVLAAPGVAPACLPPEETTYIPVSSGPTGVLIRGNGFQPGERVDFGWISSTRTPPTTKIVYHDVLPIVDVIADGSGRFACEAYLDIRFDGRPLYYQIGAFSKSTVGLEGTELLPVAILFIPAMPPAGSGGNLNAAISRAARAAFASAAALLALALAGFGIAAREERRGMMRRRSLRGFE